MKRYLLRATKTVFLVTLCLVAVIVAGCVRHSGGVWYFHEAKRPPGWPELTPVDEVQLKEYPAYREAVVKMDTSRDPQSSMFRRLFRHIQEKDIAMTAPVDMSYEPTNEEPQINSMSFLYDLPERGALANDGDVIVRDAPQRTVVSIGVRGSYSDEHFKAAHQELKTWLAEQEVYESVGPPRYLGYNSPLVPFFWRYGEVQIPVAARVGDTSQELK